MLIANCLEWFLLKAGWLYHFFFNMKVELTKFDGSLHQIFLCSNTVWFLFTQKRTSKLEIIITNPTVVSSTKFCKSFNHLLTFQPSSYVFISTFHLEELLSLVSHRDSSSIKSFIIRSQVLLWILFAIFNIYSFTVAIEILKATKKGKTICSTLKLMLIFWPRHESQNS